MVKLESEPNASVSRQLKQFSGDGFGQDQISKCKPKQAWGIDGALGIDGLKPQGFYFVRSHSNARRPGDLFSRLAVDEFASSWSVDEPQF